MKSKQQLLEVIAATEPDRCQYLTELFKYLPEALAIEMSYAQARKNEYIVSAGGASDMVYIILEGHVIGQDYQKTGHMYSFMDFTKMYIVGDFEVFAGDPKYSISVCAAEDCRLLKVSANRYLQWIRHDENALFLRIYKILTDLTPEMKIGRENLFLGCKERLVNFLLRLYEKENAALSERLSVGMTQMELANRIGYNIRSVQRSIASLEAEHAISNKNGKIAINHEQYLKLKQYQNGKEK